MILNFNFSTRKKYRLFNSTGWLKPSCVINKRYYKIFCVNENAGFNLESRLFYLTDL